MKERKTGEIDCKNMSKGEKIIKQTFCLLPALLARNRPHTSNKFIFSELKLKSKNTEDQRFLLQSKSIDSLLFLSLQALQLHRKENFLGLIFDR
jgi:hypothetical protein